VGIGEEKNKEEKGKSKRKRTMWVGGCVFGKFLITALIYFM
jgi:hypothetical protein